MAELPALTLEWPQGPSAEEAFGREWLFANGLGGYASGTLALCPTRRYHAAFVAALGGRGRTVMLSRVVADAWCDGGRYRLDAEERADGTAELGAIAALRAFALRGLVPHWEYQVGTARLERRLCMAHGENTLFLSFRHRGGPPLRLVLRPFPAFRPQDQATPLEPPPPPELRCRADQLEVTAAPGAEPLRLRLYSERPAPFVNLLERSPPLRLRVEQARGYDGVSHEISPGYFECQLAEGEALAFGATTGGWENLDRDPLQVFAAETAREEKLLDRVPAARRSARCARLVLSADQFIVAPAARPADEAWARSTGQDARSIIAGYHWFTDWGRDAMISLEGLTMCTGRIRDAAAVLKTFNRHVRDGLLPNLFPEGDTEGRYHTADATLWFFHALDRFARTAGELNLVRELWPSLEDIVAHHLRGTRFNIKVDPADGLLTQGEEGYQLTWMDAKVDRWVVTPRRGKAVEINALWFNALCLMAGWAAKLEKDPAPFLGAAERAFTSFNRRFWNERTGCLFDVVDGPEGGDDPAIRPNQLFAISLGHPVLQRERWPRVVEVVRRELLTPFGLRSLSASHPDYRPAYDGDLRARDAAYHQGTVWAYLIGPFIDAWLKVSKDLEQPRAWLEGLHRHLGEVCVGQVSEVFDAVDPFRPRGAVAQAWSVAELLRSFLKVEAT